MSWKNGLDNPYAPLDWILFEPSLGSPEMKRIVNQNSYIEKLLRVEAALAEAQAELGMIPKEAAEEIKKRASVEYIDMKKLREEVARTGGHFVVALLRAWQLGRAREYAHWGATTQDITDTAMVLLIKEAYEVILRDLHDIKDVLIDLTLKYKDTPMPGRTHVVHAVPITFGYKVSVWLDEIMRHIERFEELKERLFVGNITGAAGTLASFGDLGLEVQKRALEKLGLKTPLVSWHAARDRFAEFLNLLAMTATTLSKIATQVITLMRPEIKEIEEPIPPGHVGSSTMPQKRNPFLSEFSIACARLLRTYAHVMTEAMETLDERNFSTWLVEFVIIPESLILFSAITYNMKRVLRGLIVHPENMLRNLQLTQGAINAEALMMALALKIGKASAHELLYEIAEKSMRENIPFRDLVLSNDKIKQYIPEDKLQELLDPTKYVGLAPKIAEEVAKHASRIQKSSNIEKA